MIGLIDSQRLPKKLDEGIESLAHETQVNLKRVLRKEEIAYSESVTRV